MLVLFVYLVGILDGLNFTLFCATAIVTVGAIYLTCAHIFDEDEDAGRVAKPLRRVAYILLPLSILVPSKSTSLQMAAAYGVTEAYEVASQSEDVKRLAGKSLELLERHMDEELKED